MFHLLLDDDDKRFYLKANENVKTSLYEEAIVKDYNDFYPDESYFGDD